MSKLFKETMKASQARVWGNTLFACGCLLGAGGVWMLSGIGFPNQTHTLASPNRTNLTIRIAWDALGPLLITPKAKAQDDPAYVRRQIEFLQSPRFLEEVAEELNRGGRALWGVSPEDRKVWKEVRLLSECVCAKPGPGNGLIGVEIRGAPADNARVVQALVSLYSRHRETERKAADFEFLKAKYDGDKAEAQRLLDEIADLRQRANVMDPDAAAWTLNGLMGVESAQRMTLVSETNARRSKAKEAAGDTQRYWIKRRGLLERAFWLRVLQLKMGSEIDGFEPPKYAVIIEAPQNDEAVFGSGRLAGFWFLLPGMFLCWQGHRLKQHLTRSGEAR